MATKKVSLPRTVGATIDMLWQLREQERALDEQKKEISAQAKLLEDHLKSNFAKSDITGARGKAAQVSFTQSTQADVTDWPTFYTWISRNKAWECLQRRPGITAIRERWEAGKQIPGVEPVIIEKMNLTALK